MPSTSPRSRSARRAVRLEIEPLENRFVLAVSAGAGVVEVARIALMGRTLTVEGTGGPDRIAITRGGPAGAIRVVVNGEARLYEGVGDVAVRAGAGDDVVRVGDRVTLPTRVVGGS